MRRLPAADGNRRRRRLERLAAAGKRSQGGTNEGEIVHSSAWIGYPPCAIILAMATTSELLDAWRDATRAAELAKRLAEIAEEAALKADADASAAEEISGLAEQVAASAEVAARKARATSDRLRAVAAQAGGTGRDEAQAPLRTANEDETRARDLYHEAEEAARSRAADRHR